jgi:hypothetical protein
MNSNPSLPAAWQPRSALTIAVTVAGLAGTAAIVLPFTYDVSPALAAQSSYVQLGLPLCLALPIAIASLRWAMSGTVPRWLCVVGYVSALAAATAWLSLYAGFRFDGMFNPDIRNMPARAVTPPMVVAVALAALFVLAWRRGAPEALRPVLVMQAVYVGDAVMCLVAFDGDLQVGAYCVAVAAAAYAVQSLAVTTWAPITTRPMAQPSRAQ